MSFFSNKSGKDNQVIGPSSSTDNAVARFDGITGKNIQNSSVFIMDNGNVGVGTATGVNHMIEIIGTSSGFTSGRVGVQITNTVSGGDGTGAFMGAYNGNIQFGGSSAGHAVYLESGNNINLALPANGDVYLGGTGADDPALAKIIIKNSGNIGIGVASPTAYLNIKAGTATASTAPLKFTSGTVNTTAETGAMEYNGTNLSFVPTGTLRENVHTGSRGNITLTAGTTTTVTDAKAKTTSTVIISPTSISVIALTPYVSTKNNGSFVITTLSAVGTETLDYLIVN